MMKKKKILFLMPYSPPIHGAAVMGGFIHDSAAINGQYDTRYINTITTRRLDEPLLALKIPWRSLVIWLRLLPAVLFHRYDLCCLAITCHGAGFLKDAPMVLLCKLLRQPVVIYQHNQGMARDAHRSGYRTLFHWCYRNVPVILLSRFLMEDVATHVKPEQVLICPNGIAPMTAIPPAGTGLQPLKFLFLSHLMAAKGIFVLLDACAILRERHVPFSCDIVGGGTQDLSLETLREEIRKRGMEQLLTVYGRKTGAEKESLFRQCGIFIFPSQNEAFPLVLLEAMQLGKPCISSRVGGTPDIVEDGQTGILFPVGDAEAMAAAMERLAQDPKSATAMGQAGRERFEHCFSRERYEQNFGECLKKAMSFYHR